MATLETQYKNWLKENEPIEYSEWLKKFGEIHNFDKVPYPKIINEGVNEGASEGVNEGASEGVNEGASDGVKK